MSPSKDKSLKNMFLVQLGTHQGLYVFEAGLEFRELIRLVRLRDIIGCYQCNIGGSLNAS